jgi:predicted outer membrane repeat protein
MKKIKTFLILLAIACLFLNGINAQTPICVDGSASGTGNGTPANPYNTIQAAVNAASNGDIIKVAKGTYSQAVQISQKKVQLLGGFAGSGDFNSANPQTNVTTIKGTSAAPCILVDIDKEISGLLIIRGFTIRNGQRGIELSGGWSEKLNNITIENNIIEENGMPDIGHRGGGIGLEGNNVTIQNNVFRNNKSGRGGAIAATSDFLVNFLIADNRIENNTGYADHAGAISLTGTGSVTRNIFDGNVAAKSYDYGWGGAMLIFNTNADTLKVVTLSHNVYRNNYAPSRGGAVFVDDGIKVLMDHELFYNNKSKESGSAIYVDAHWDYTPSVLYMDNCTVWGNSSDESDGAVLFVQGSKTHIQNSIFWNNGSDFVAIDDLPAKAKLTVNYSLTQKGYAGTGNIKSDPLFANAANGDFHVKSKAGRFNPATGQFVIDNVSSPAIDAGNPASDFSKEPQPNGGRVNLGCYGNTAEASKSAPAGVDENKNILWTIFPNPAKESVAIDNLPIGSNIEIFDITGKKVYSSVIEKEQTTISTANFENGVYIIQIESKGVVNSRKFVVSK